MKRALRLAARGRGAVEPNPMVGCVIVKRGRIIGEGFHGRFGGPHAEIEALRRCSTSPRGATVYVTLEPCCYTGKTPPCTDALIEARVGRVVAAMRDPNPRVSGRGLRKLSAAGIAAECGLLGDEARALNAPFTKLVSRRRPWVILKWAQSLDGRIATRTGDSKWISDERCRAHSHRVRGLVDAIIVGRGTVETDDPMLTARVGRPRRTATRIVLDSQLRTPASANVVRTASDYPTWIVCSDTAPRSRARAFEAAGCRVIRVPGDASGVSLEGLLDTLGRHEMTNVLVEGGARVLGAFADAHLADEFHVYIASLLIGGAEATPALGGAGAATVGEALKLPADTKLRRLGDGWLAQARV